MTVFSEAAQAVHERWVGDRKDSSFSLDLLAITAEYCAAHVPAYHSYASQLRGVRSLEDLAQLPVTFSEGIQKYNHQFISRASTTDFTVFSGGTTSGKNKYIHRSFDEYAALDEFRGIWFARNLPQSFRTAEYGQGRYIIIDDEHGIRYIERNRGPLKLMNFPLFKESHFAIAKDVLCEFGERNNIFRVTELRGAYPKVRLLSLYALEHSWRNLPIDIRRVYSGGFFTTDRWREIYRRAWGAQALQEYGQTEFHQSYATECEACNWYHYAPCVIPEVVSTEDPSIPVQQGIGRLLMTHLYPYAQRQVLLRYDTGDIMQIGDSCDVTGLRMYMPMGRAGDVLQTRDGRYISPAVIQNAVDVPGVLADTVDLMEYQPDIARLGPVGVPQFCAKICESPRGEFLDVRFVPDGSNGVPALTSLIEERIAIAIANLGMDDLAVHVVSETVDDLAGRIQG